MEKELSDVDFLLYQFEESMTSCLSMIVICQENVRII